MIQLEFRAFRGLFQQAVANLRHKPRAARGMIAMHGEDCPGKPRVTGGISKPRTRR